MTLSLQDLLNGPELPTKDVHIGALGDAITIQPVPLKRYREYKDATTEADQQNLIQQCVAESLSQQSGMTLEEALALNAKVQAELHPAAWDEITRAVLETMFGEGRLVSAEAQAEGND